jgi:hypothetical protein
VFLQAGVHAARVQHTAWIERRLETLMDSAVRSIERSKRLIYGLVAA